MRRSDPDPLEPDLYAIVTDVLRNVIPATTELFPVADNPCGD